MPKDHILLLHNVLKHVSDAVVAVDLSLCIITWNPAAEHIYGWKESEVLGRHIGDIVETEYTQGDGESAYLQLEQQGKWTGEVIQKNRNGNKILIQSSVSSITDSSDQSVGFVAINRDVTSFREATETIQKIERRFERVSRATTDAIWEWHIPTDSVWWSDGLFKLFGHDPTKTDFNNQWWLDHIHPDDLTRIIVEKAQLLQSENAYWKFEYRFQKVDKTYAWVHDQAFLERDLHSQPYRATGGISDITQRKQAEKSLKESRECFFKVFDTNPAAQAIVQNEDRQILEVNESYTKLTGYSRQDLIGQTITALNIYDDNQCIKIEQQKTKQGIPQNIEMPIQTSSGERREVLFSGEELEMNGKPSLLTCLIDNTDRKRAEQKIEKLNIDLTKRQSRLQAMIDSSEDVFVLTSPEGSKYVSANVYRILGYTQEEYVKMPTSEFIHPDDYPLRWNELKQPGDSIKLLSYRCLHKNGEWRWVEGSATNLTHAEGLNGIFISIRDITERKNAEVALRKSEAHLLQLTNSLPQLVWTCLPDGQCDYLSKQWLAYTGIPKEQQLGLDWTNQIHPDDRERIIPVWHHAVENRTNFRMEIRIRRYDGMYRWFDAQTTRLDDAEGNLVKWFGSNTDIDDKKQIELENLEVNEELDKFVYSVSHDLRSPLVGIMGLITLTRDEVQDDEAKDYLNKMETNVTKLDNILHSILDYSYNSRHAVKAEPIEINDLVNKCLENLDYMPHFDRVQKEVQVHQQTALISD